MMRLIVVRIAPVTPVTDEQKRELTSIAQSRSLPAGYVFRAKLILMLSEGATFAIIRERLKTTNPTIIRWKDRFVAGRGHGRLGYEPSRAEAVSFNNRIAGQDPERHAQ